MVLHDRKVGIMELIRNTHELEGASDWLLRSQHSQAPFGEKLQCFAVDFLLGGDYSATPLSRLIKVGCGCSF